LRKLLEWHPTRAPLLLIQTFTAKHPALLSVLEGQDAEHYPKSELMVREMLRYPPFAKLAQVQVAARRPDDAARAALEAAAVLRDRGAQNDELLGPAPAPIARIKGLYAHNLLLRSDSSDRLEQLLETVKRGKGGARIRIDVNPRDIGELLE
jgi:primosomal protein N' (replication factor Y) (superfamily II helicase)